MNKKAYVAPKYPRLMVSPARHAKLAKEAAKRNISIMVLVEEKFKVADKAAK